MVLEKDNIEEYVKGIKKSDEPNPTGGFRDAKYSKRSFVNLTNLEKLVMDNAMQEEESNDNPIMHDKNLG